MRGADKKEFQNIGASTTANFPLEGGIYIVDAVGTAFTAVLNRLGPDHDVAGSAGTFLPVMTTINANGNSPALSLPQGTYQFVVTGTAVSVRVQRIPDVG